MASGASDGSSRVSSETREGRSNQTRNNRTSVHNAASSPLARAAAGPDCKTASRRRSRDFYEPSRDARHVLVGPSTTLLRAQAYSRTETRGRRELAEAGKLHLALHALALLEAHLAHRASQTPSPCLLIGQCIRTIQGGRRRRRELEWRQFDRGRGRARPRR